MLLADRTVHRKHQRWRVFRTFMYALLIGSGVLVSIDPSQLVIAQVGNVWAEIWALDLLVSSVGCFIGSFSDRWIGEYGFLPLLFSVLALYGLSAMFGFDDGPGHNLTLLAFGLLVLGFSSGLVARWQDVRDVKDEAGLQNGE